MLMNFLSGIFLLLIVQAFDYVSSQETKPKKGGKEVLLMKWTLAPHMHEELEEEASRFHS